MNVKEELGWSDDNVGPVTWQEMKERIPGDYGPPQNPGQNKGMSREEELAYWDEVLSDEEKGYEINY